MDIFTNDAPEQMKITVDSDVLNGVYGDALQVIKVLAGAISGNLNLGASGVSLAITKDGASSTVAVLDAILRVGQALDERECSETGRWMVIPSWIPVLKNSELRQSISYWR